MGCSQSYPGLTEDVLEDYKTLTYLSTGEMLHLMKKFYSINPEKLEADFHHRFSREEIIDKFRVLKIVTSYVPGNGSVGCPPARWTDLKVAGSGWMRRAENCVMALGYAYIQQWRDRLMNNPFQDRIFRVFSSRNDDCFSFEDMLDLYSAMSAECPVEVKAAWAFRVFDLDGDNQISAGDIAEILDRLTWDSNHRFEYLNKDDKQKIADIILEEIKLDSTGSIGLSEFKILMTRIPEFESSFYFRL